MDDAGGMLLRAELRGHTEDVSERRGGWRERESARAGASPFFLMPDPPPRCPQPLSQVRALAVLPGGTIATGSRDKTVKLWASAGAGFEEKATLVRQGRIGGARRGGRSSCV